MPTGWLQGHGFLTTPVGILSIPLAGPRQSRFPCGTAVEITSGVHLGHVLIHHQAVNLGLNDVDQFGISEVAASLISIRWSPSIGMSGRLRSESMVDFVVIRI
ncbi:hypothetical protein L7E55_17160 [Pelotomaculum isophthalicicum JI]|uniref:Uncharacterized protein n=1 Tax=Pelotomaculum isophthalicicum JI TaxID=947010 RepID=A0A9X4JUX9_9FIRM|nr:hypothetical protein [Pelotomaculum isophthalicicum]MDF9410045.1 hypothetical protein [Pelotomaculum isophthalicicum JI]